MAEMLGLCVGILVAVTLGLFAQYGPEPVLVGYGLGVVCGMLLVVAIKGNC